MADYAVRIDMASWQQSLAAGGPEPAYGVEAPVELLASCPRFVQSFELEGWRVVNVRDALPLEHAPYMSECSPVIRRGLVESLAAVLELGRCFAAGCATLDLGLDRVEGNEGLRERAEILKEALALSSSGPTLCVQVRVPRRFPRSAEWRMARELVPDDPASRLGIAANVVVMDISPQPDPADVLALLGGRLRLVRLLLDGHGPGCCRQATVERWLDALGGLGSPPAVVFSALVHDPEALPAFHREIAATVRSHSGPRRRRGR